jgi:hypothetical protein
MFQSRQHFQGPISTTLLVMCSLAAIVLLSKLLIAQKFRILSLLRNVASSLADLDTVSVGLVCVVVSASVLLLLLRDSPKLNIKPINREIFK